MDIGSSQPPDQAGRTRILSLRRRNRDPVPSSAKQLTESTELLLPSHHQFENASPPGASSRASGEAELKFETAGYKAEEEEREAQGTGLAGGQTEQSGHISQVSLSGFGGSKKSRSKKGEVDHRKERVPGRLDLGLGAEDGDFTDMPPPEAKPKRRRKRRRNEQPQSYLEAVEDDELQLALALSASLDPLRGIEPPLSTAEETGRQKKRKRGRKGEVGVAPPLLTVSSSQARNILAERAEQILEAQGCGDGSDDEIPCTPAFGTSELAQPPGPQRCSPTTVLRDDNEGVALPFLTSDRKEESRTIASNVDTLKLDHQEVEVVVMDETVGSPLESVGGGSKLETGGVNPCNSEQGKEREDLGVDVACDADQQVQGESLPLKKDLEVLATVTEVSFHANSQELGYQTLWKLSSYGEEEDVSNFYVPGLAALISPRKGQPTVCRTCRSDPCLALSARTEDTSAQPAAADLLRGPACVPPGITGASSFSHGVDKLIVDLYSLIGSPLLSDAVITTRNGARIPAHAVILACRSPALSQVISQCSERPVLLDFSEFDEETVFAFLECIYTGSTSLLKEESMRRNLADIAQRWSLEEIALLCRSWEDSDITAGDDDANWEGKLAISNPTSPITDTELLPAPHSSKSRAESSDEQTTLETHTQSATEHLSALKFASAADCTVLVDPSVPGATPVSESFTTTSCDEVVMISPVNTPVVTAAMEADAELQSKDVDNARRGGILLVASDEDCEATITCTVEGTPTTVSCTDEGTPNMVSCSMPADCACSETVNNSTSDEISRRGCSSTRAVHLPSDVICVSPTPSPVFCTSSPPESEKSPGASLDYVCLSGASSDDILLCSPPTPLFNLLKETELSPRHVVNPSGKLSLPCVTTSSPTSPTASDSSECTTDWLVTRSPPFLLATCPEVIGASPGLRQQCRGNQAVDCGVEVSGVDHSPASCVGFKTPRVERSCASRQGPVREQCTTPACGGVVLESDDNITPMPTYRTMPTPILKEECSQFGVKPLPKKQMIAKLQEIYEYTHPLVDKDCYILVEDKCDAQPPARKNINAPTTTSTRLVTTKPPSPKKSNRVNVKTKRKDYQDTGGDESSQGSVTEGEDISQRIKEFIMSAKDLYQDILLYKPLELCLIQARLKSAGIAVGKGRLADILDHWCVTYSVPRMTQKTQKRGRTGIKSVV